MILPYGAYLYVGDIMTYSGTYDVDDTDDIVMDFIGTVGVALVGFATLIGLVMVYKYFKKNVPGLKI